MKWSSVDGAKCDGVKLIVAASSTAGALACDASFRHCCTRQLRAVLDAPASATVGARLPSGSRGLGAKAHSRLALAQRNADDLLVERRQLGLPGERTDAHLVLRVPGDELDGCMAADEPAAAREENVLWLIVVLIDELTRCQDAGEPEFLGRKCFAVCDHYWRFEASRSQAIEKMQDVYDESNDEMVSSMTSRKVRSCEVHFNEVFNRCDLLCTQLACTCTRPAHLAYKPMLYACSCAQLAF